MILNYIVHYEQNLVHLYLFKNEYHDALLNTMSYHPRMKQIPMYLISGVNVNDVLD